MIPPNPKILVKAVGRAVKAKIKGRKLLVPSDVEDERLGICETCQFFTEDRQCRRCTCFVDAKVVLATESCPVDKWGEWNMLTEDQKRSTEG